MRKASRYCFREKYYVDLFQRVCGRQDVSRRKSGGTRVISFEINVFEGDLNVEARKELIKRVTDAVRKHRGLNEEDLAPVYVIIRDVPEGSWGVFGASITLDNLRNPRSDAKPI